MFPNSFQSYYHRILLNPINEMIIPLQKLSF
jgi:hypothetical protein